MENIFLKTIIDMPQEMRTAVILNLFFLLKDERNKNKINI